MEPKDKAGEKAALIAGWEKQAYRMLKAELSRRGLTYQDLKEALEKIGVHKTLHNLGTTVREGKFSFYFFLQCAKAIGMNKLHLDED